jgi:hypothetical protein
MTADEKKQRRERLRVATLAARIPNETVLLKVLADVQPAMRGAVLEQIRPHLRFPVAVTA